MEYLVDQFNQRNILFVELNEALTFAVEKPEVREKLFGDKEKKTMRENIKDKFKGAWIANKGFTRVTANEAIEKGNTDLVSFGHLYVENTNLVEKFAKEIEPTSAVSLTGYTPELMGLYYGHTAAGYTDLSGYERIFAEKSSQ
jgi:N-ethylmaleimide reductase